MKRTKDIIEHLIKLEKDRRKAYLNAYKTLKRDFSDGPIKQMRNILKNKRLDYNDNLTLERLIDSFEKETKKGN